MSDAESGTYVCCIYHLAHHKAENTQHTCATMIVWVANNEREMNTTDANEQAWSKRTQITQHIVKLKKKRTLV